MENGELDLMVYIEELKKCVERNEKLKEFYKSKGEKERLRFILGLNESCQAELKEIEEQMAQGE
jgi:hypothetical protein